jgi:hypothetical protein
MQWIKHIYLEIEPVSNMVAEEWHTTHERDMSTIYSFAIVGIPPIADS